MAVVKCNNGHFYDSIKYGECPHCSNGVNKVRKETFVDDIDKFKIRKPYTSSQIDVQTVSLDIETPSSDGKTVGIYSFSEGTQLLTGWLVSIKGLTKGRDFKLYNGWNRIGRSADMDVYIPEDNKISLKGHASIVFDSKAGKFFLVNQSGSLTYLNNQYVADSIVINTGDKITIGHTELIFIAFCTEGRKWEE